MRKLLLLLTIAFAPLTPAQAATPYDGTWLVLFACPAAPGGAAGYTRRFLASVQDGLLHGEIGTRGQPSYLALDGRIPQGGAATLLGTGYTGDAQYAVGRPNPGTAYSFHLQSKFDPAHGTGTRLETRACDAVFTRQ